MPTHRTQSPPPSRVARFPWLRLSCFLLTCFAIGFPFTKTGKDAVRAWDRRNKKRNLVITQKPAPRPKPKPKPAPKPKPSPIISLSKNPDIGKLGNKDIPFKYKANFKPGGKASVERKRKDSYTATYTLDIRTPQAIYEPSDLSAINPHLAKILPDLPSLLKDAKVSPFYQTLYRNKQKRLKTVITRLDKLLTRHNYFDCETMLEMRHSTTGRRAFLLQADMDVVTDGSDGDRLPVMPEEVVTSTHYQPTTSYGWDKTGKIENPMIAGLRSRIEKGTAEMNTPSTSSARRQWLKTRIARLKRIIDDLSRRSYLIAEYDPFIVISIDMLTANRSIKSVPRIGDYVVVIYQDKLYPAIVGDGGPTFKAGEASLRLAKQINSIATSYHRPVSDLSVSYLVFPGSAKKPHRAPDYDDIHKECQRLLDEIGGISSDYELFTWPNTLPPLPEPEMKPETDDTQPDGTHSAEPADTTTPYSPLHTGTNSPTDS